MATTTNNNSWRDELLTAEQAYYSAVDAREDSAIRALSADRCLVVGPTGARIVDRETAAEMVRTHDVTEEYRIEEDSVSVLPLDEHTAAISYRLETLVPGSAQVSTSFATSIWQRDDSGDLRCVVHTSSPEQVG